MQKVDSKIDTYKTAGTGAVVAGAGTGTILNSRLNNIARGTVKALSSENAAVCDEFMARNNKVISKAIESPAGFFGKLNKALNNLGSVKNTESIQKAGSDTIGEYWKTAASQIKGKYTGDKLMSETGKIRNKLMQQDILKSFKSTTKLGRFAVVSAATTLGAILACTLKEILSSKNTSSKKNLHTDGLRVHERNLRTSQN